VVCLGSAYLLFAGGADAPAQEKAKPGTQSKENAAPKKAAGVDAAEKQKGLLAWVPRYLRMREYLGAEKNLVSFIVGDSPAAVIDFYDAQLTKGGFKVSRGLAVKDGETLVMGSLDAQKEARKVSVVAAGAGKGRRQVEVSWESKAAP
jgi:hypothetical protein